MIPFFLPYHTYLFRPNKKPQPKSQSFEPETIVQSEPEMIEIEESVVPSNVIDFESIPHLEVAQNLKQPQSQTDENLNFISPSQTSTSKMDQIPSNKYDCFCIIHFL